jgi:hypothetical protein
MMPMMKLGYDRRDQFQKEQYDSVGFSERNNMRNKMRYTSKVPVIIKSEVQMKYFHSVGFSDPVTLGIKWGILPRFP